MILAISRIALPEDADAGGGGRDVEMHRHGQCFTGTHDGTLRDAAESREVGRDGTAIRWRTS